MLKLINKAFLGLPIQLGDLNYNFSWILRAFRVCFIPNNISLEAKRGLLSYQKLNQSHAFIFFFFIVRNFYTNLSCRLEVLHNPPSFFII
jgi:hypothetical protein